VAVDESYLPDENAVVQTFDIAPSTVAAEVESAVPAFQILRTMELDPTDELKRPAAEEHARVAAKALAQSEEFAGSSRTAAKLSIANAPTTSYKDLGKLLDSLPKDSDMIKLHIPTDPESNRVAEEEKNVSVSTWLYAASREGDNDFHTILGTDPAKVPRRFLNAEVSGLPPAGSASFVRLKDARADFASIVRQTPLAGYDFYKPPIPVTVEGSLFFDQSHAEGGATPGPTRTKPKTIWEIHPITSMKTRRP
jgi:hypothetical protein